MAIRPEAIRLGSGPLSGEIRGRSLLGNVIRYRVASRGVELSVDVLNRSAADLLLSGRTVALEIAPEAIRELEG